MSLGCLEEASVRVIRNGKKILETDKVNCEWNRIVDADGSKGTFTIPTSCCPAPVHAISDFVEFERNGVVEWAGYVLRPEFDGNTLTIEATDLLFGYQRRIIKQALEHIDTDLSQIFTDYADAANDFDPLPLILVPNDSGILGTRHVTIEEYRIAWSAMSELLSIGLDVTTVGRRAFVGPLNTDILPPIRLTERMVKGDVQPVIGEEGTPYANRIVVKGANGLVGIHPPGDPARPNVSYPLIEMVIDAQGDVEDQESLDQMALEQYNMRSQVPTFVSMDQGVSLRDSTPYDLQELIAGRGINLVYRSVCGLIQQAMRIASLTYRLHAREEMVMINLAPAGTIQTEELLVFA